MLIESVETHGNQPTGAGPGYHNPNQAHGNQPVGVSPGCCAASDVSGGSRVQKTGAGARRLIARTLSAPFQTPLTQRLTSDAIVRSVTAQLRMSSSDTVNHLRNQPYANQPVGVSPGSRAASGVRRGSRVQKTGAGAHRLMGLGRIDIARQGYDSSNQPCANQPMGVSPGSRSASGAGGGSRVLRTGANAHRLIELGRFDIVEQGYDLSINRYKEVVHEEVDHRPPQAILDELESIEKEITQGMKQLRGMLK